MEVSKDTLESPSDDLEFSLHNESSSTLKSDERWHELYRWDGDRWFRASFVSQIAAIGKPTEIAPGEQRRWIVRQDTSDLGTPIPDRTFGSTDLAYRFPPGHYAFGFRVRTDTATRTTDDTTSRTSSVPGYHLYLARFRVSGDSFNVSPSNAVVDTFSEGNTLVVRTQTDSNDDSEREVSLHVEEQSSIPEGTPTMSRFQLYNPRYALVSDPEYEPFEFVRATSLLRDGFGAYEDSHSTIRIESVNKLSRISVGRGLISNVQFDGKAWELSGTEGWSSRGS